MIWFQEFPFKILKLTFYDGTGDGIQDSVLGEHAAFHRAALTAPGASSFYSAPEEFDLELCGFLFRLCILSILGFIFFTFG